MLYIYIHTIPNVFHTSQTSWSTVWIDKVTWKFMDNFSIEVLLCFRLLYLTIQSEILKISSWGFKTALLEKKNRSFATYRSLHLSHDALFSFRYSVSKQNSQRSNYTEFDCFMLSQITDIPNHSVQPDKINYTAGSWGNWNVKCAHLRQVFVCCSIMWEIAVEEFLV